MPLDNKMTGNCNISLSRGFCHLKRKKKRYSKKRLMPLIRHPHVHTGVRARTHTHHSEHILIQIIVIPLSLPPKSRPSVPHSVSPPLLAPQSPCTRWRQALSPAGDTPAPEVSVGRAWTGGAIAGPEETYRHDAALGEGSSPSWTLY